jgi:hypothetical protein
MTGVRVPYCHSHHPFESAFSSVIALLERRSDNIVRRVGQRAAVAPRAGRTFPARPTADGPCMESRGEAVNGGRLATQGTGRTVARQRMHQEER